MSQGMSTLVPVGVAVLAMAGIALTHGPVSYVLNVVCVLLALTAVVRYVLHIDGHDAWRELRRERKRRGRR